MFSLRTCSVEGCHHSICADENTCYHHSNDKETILAQAQGLLGGKEDLFDLSVSEAHFCGLTLAPKRMAGNNLAWCTFTDVDFSSISMANCFFDFCLF